MHVWLLGARFMYRFISAAFDQMTPACKLALYKYANSISTVLKSRVMWSCAAFVILLSKNVLELGTWSVQSWWQLWNPVMRRPVTTSTHFLWPSSQTVLITHIWQQKFKELTHEMMSVGRGTECCKWKHSSCLQGYNHCIWPRSDKNWSWPRKCMANQRKVHSEVGNMKFSWLRSVLWYVFLKVCPLPNRSQKC